MCSYLPDKIWVLKPQKDHSEVREVLTMYTLNFSWAQFDEAQLDVEVVKEMNHEVLRLPHPTVYEAKRPEEPKTDGNGLLEKYPEVIIWGRILKLLGWEQWIFFWFLEICFFMSLSISLYKCIGIIHAGMIDLTSSLRRQAVFTFHVEIFCQRQVQKLRRSKQEKWKCQLNLETKLACLEDLTLTALILASDHVIFKVSWKLEVANFGNELSN